MTDNNDNDGTLLGATLENKILPFPNSKKVWPTPVEPQPVDTTLDVPSDDDPDERKILLTLVDGEYLFSGYLGLTNSFLAIGNKSGGIKFAAAPGFWKYASDVTGLDMNEIELVTDEDDSQEV